MPLQHNRSKIILYSNNKAEINIFSENSEQKSVKKQLKFRTKKYEPSTAKNAVLLVI